MKFISCLLSGLALTGLSSALPTATTGDIASPVKRQTATATLGLAAYWGQPGISDASLTSVCTDSSYTHVNLAFITNLFGPNGYPVFNLDNRGPTAAQGTKAPGLINGLSLREAIGKCQSRGIKVTVSIGGSTGLTQFTAARYAQAAATNIWNVFLGGTTNTTTKDIRPFAEVVLDGVDLDPENQKPAFYADFIKALRAKMATDTTRKYVITASPQCARNYLTPAGQPPGDKSLPDTVLKLVDHVYVQFYNNPSCNHGTAGLLSGVDSIKTWATAVSPAKVWVGAPASTDKVGGVGGYIASGPLATEVANVKKLKLSNFGGYMLWTSEAAKKNNNFQLPLRAALNKA